MSSDAISDERGAILLHATVVADLLDGLLDRFLSTSPLAPREFEIMTVLSVRGPQPPSVLSAVTGVPAPSVSRVTGRLERAGMVTQTSNPTDRRSRIVALTDRGRAAFDTAQAAFRELYGAVVDTLGEELPVAAFGVRRLEWALRVVSGTPVSEPPGIEGGVHALHYAGPALDAQEEAEVLDYIEWVRARPRPLLSGATLGSA